MERLEQGVERDKRGHIELRAIWYGEIDEVRLFALDGQPLDPDEDRRTLDAWVEAIQRDARHRGADVEIRMLKHDHPVDDEHEGCVCWRVPSGHLYWTTDPLSLWAW